MALRRNVDLLVHFLLLPDITCSLILLEKPKNRRGKKIDSGGDMKNFAVIFCAFCCCLTSAVSFAEPTSEKVKILNVRPYHNTSGGPAEVYIVIDRISLCGTNTYRIPLGWGGAKESVAAAMSAVLTGRDVQIEIDNAGCGSPAWTTNIQSIYLW